MTAPRQFSSAVEPTVADYDLLGRVMAERLRVGPGYLYDVRERAKARRRWRSLTLYERVLESRGNP